MSDSSSPEPSKSVSNAGTIAFVAEFPRPWPNTRWAVACALADGTVGLDCTPDGALRLRVVDGSGVPCHEVTCARLQFVGYSLSCVVCTWGAAGACIYLDGALLPHYEPNKVLRIDGGPLPNERNALEDPEAETACKTWVGLRRAKFVSAAAKPNHREKADEEQARELRVAITNLRRFVKQIEDGGDSAAGPLAGQLRALLYWEKDSARDRNYSPLLLRLASWADLPLPVYFMKTGHNAPVQPSMSVSMSGPSLVSRLQAEQIGDLQEWFKSAEVSLKALASPVTSREVLKASANSLGGAHFDEDVHVVIDALTSVKFRGVDLHLTYLCRLGVVVANLADWVLSQLAARGLLRQPDSSV